MWQGFREFLSLGWINRVPRLVAAQSEAAAPFVAAMEKAAAEIEPVMARETSAESIQVGNPAALGWRALAALRASKGAAGAACAWGSFSAPSFSSSLPGAICETAAAGT